jgi:hypothetical protein
VLTGSPLGARYIAGCGDGPSRRRRPAPRGLRLHPAAGDARGDGVRAARTPVRGRAGPGPNRRRVADPAHWRTAVDRVHRHLYARHGCVSGRPGVHRPPPGAGHPRPIAQPARAGQQSGVPAGYSAGQRGRITLAVRVAAEQLLPSLAVGCLDRPGLTAAVAGLRASGATQVDVGGHTVTATLPAGSTGVAVVAAPAVAGWRCSRDRGTPSPPVSFRGFLGVPLGGGASRVNCSYQPPGLRAGLLVSGSALIILLGVAAAGRLLRRWRPWAAHRPHVDGGSRRESSSGRRGTAPIGPPPGKPVMVR